MAGGRDNASQDKSKEAEVQTPLVGGKRNSPDSGFTPPLADPRRRLNEPAVKDMTQVCGTNPNTATSQDIHKTNQTRWSIRITTDTILERPHRILQAFAARCSDLKISDTKLSHSQKVILIRSESPERDLNSMLKHVDEVSKALKLSNLKVDHFNVRPKPQDPTRAHVIIRNVPDFFDTDDIKNELKTWYTEDVLETVARIVSRSGQETSLVKLVFRDERPAQELIMEGKVCLWGMVLKCEAAHTRPPILRCFKCQGIGHTSHKCTATTQACAKCGANHRTSECLEVDKNNWHCVNCKGPHATWYHKCPVNQQFIEERRTNPVVNDHSVQNDSEQQNKTRGTDKTTYRDILVSGQQRDNQTSPEIDALKKENKALQEQNQILQDKVSVLTELMNTTLVTEMMSSLAELLNAVGKIKDDLTEQREALATLREQQNSNFVELATDVHWLTAFHGHVCSRDTLKRAHKMRVKGSPNENQYVTDKPKLTAIVDAKENRTKGKQLNQSHG